MGLLMSCYNITFYYLNILPANNKNGEQIETPMNARDFLHKTKYELENHAMFADPYMLAFEHMEIFDIECAQRFATLYYPHILRTRLYQASTLGLLEDEALQFVLAEILDDEYGQGDITRSHMELYRNFMRAVGCEILPVHEYQIIPELADYIESMQALTRNGDWLSAVAAVGIASEWPIPRYYSCLLAGLKKIPDIEIHSLELFSGHISLDVEHSRMIEEAVLPHLSNSTNQQRFSAGIEINMRLRRKLHAGLYREVFASECR